MSYPYFYLTALVAIYAGLRWEPIGWALIGLFLTAAFFVVFYASFNALRKANWL